MPGPLFLPHFWVPIRPMLPRDTPTAQEGGWALCPPHPARLGTWATAEDKGQTWFPGEAAPTSLVDSPPT